jgi:hypothetical protein
MAGRDELGYIHLSASVSFRPQGPSLAAELLALVGGSSRIARVVSRDHKGLRLRRECSSHRILAVQQRGEGKAYGVVVRGGVPASRGCGSEPRESSSPPGWHCCWPHMAPSPPVAESWERARESDPAGFTWRTAVTTPPRRTPNTQGRICGTSMR